MPKNVKIDVHHVTRIEGHGNLVVRATDGVVEKAEWQVPEAPRFFESFVRGRRWDEVQGVVSRICGICSISHSLVAIKAVENAFKIQLTDELNQLRTLTHYSEMLQSHVLHVGYLVAPDLFNVKSVVPLVETHLDVVKKIVALHRAANEWSDLLAGRTTHPITIVPGGFTRIPTQREFRDLHKRLSDLVPMAQEVAEVVLSAADKLPGFTRETEYVALKKKGVYAFYDGEIATSDLKELTPVNQFEKVVNEYVTPQSTAKWARWHRDSYAVGALSRYNLNREELSPLAKKWAQMFGLGEKVINPYLNSVVQLVECAHVLEYSLAMLENMMTRPPKEAKVGFKVQAGNGSAAVEAPRGILFHRYLFNEDGVCTAANLCIPTNQNHGNLQKDVEALVPSILNLSQTDIQKYLEMLVRAYDPCVSCSTHYLDVKFV